MFDMSNFACTKLNVHQVRPSSTTRLRVLPCCALKIFSLPCEQSNSLVTKKVNFSELSYPKVKPKISAFEPFLGVISIPLPLNVQSILLSRQFSRLHVDCKMVTETMTARKTRSRVLRTAHPRKLHMLLVLASVITDILGCVHFILL